MIRKAWEGMQDAHYGLVEGAMTFLDSMWKLLAAEWKSPRHLDKYMLAGMLVTAIYVMASCGKPAF